MQFSFRNDKGTEVEMPPATVTGNVTRDAPEWPIFSLSLVKVPEVFAQVDSAQFPSRF